MRRLIPFLQERIQFSADEVYPNLFMSSKISRSGDIEKVEKLGINTVIDLEGGFDPPMEWLETYLYWPIYDVPMLPDCWLLLSVATFGMMEIKRKNKVLVHCSQGLNRSGLIAGRIMILCGLPGQRVVNQIREKRVGSLFNPVFVDYLRSFY